MAVLDIVLYPDDPLTVTAAPFDEVTPAEAKLAADMIETMHAFEGVGLAGPQVGLSKRIFVLCEPDGAPMCFINPRIIESEGSEVGEEGCLSLPQVYAQVPRAQRIVVEALDAHGEPFTLEARDFLARIIQHENDHLDGILFPDRLDILSREAVLHEWKSVREQLEAVRG